VIRAILPYFGGKRNLAAAIVEELGPHSAYWEPFAGSLAVILRKPRTPMETVNDLNGDVINLARVIVDPQLGRDLYRRLSWTLMHEETFAACKDALRTAGELPAAPDEPDLERAVRYFVASWMGRNGTAGAPLSDSGTYCVRYTTNGGHAGTRWVAACRSILAWRRRLAHVTFLNRDAFELLERIEDARGTAIYCDPPYVVKGARYLHDFRPEDHTRLAVALARFQRARVVVSYYADPLIEELYPRDRWTWRAIEVSKAMAHQGARGPNDKRVVELLLCNGKSFAAAVEAPPAETREPADLPGQGLLFGAAG